MHGFEGEMLLGNLIGQDDLWVELRSKDKGVLPRNLGIFGTVGSGKSNSCQVIIEEAARNGWAVIVLDVEGEYTDMDQPADDSGLVKRLDWFGLEPAGLKDFHVFHPASCASDRAGSEPFTLRLADFETNVIGEILQVTLPERNAAARLRRAPPAEGPHQGLHQRQRRAQAPARFVADREAAVQPAQRCASAPSTAPRAARSSSITRGSRPSSPGSCIRKRSTRSTSARSTWRG